METTRQVCVCVCVCVLLCMQVFMYVHVCIHVCIHVCMYVYMYVYVCMYVCMYVSESTVVLYVGMARKKNGRPYISIASDELKSLVIYTDKF